MYPAIWMGRVNEYYLRMAVCKLFNNFAKKNNFRYSCNIFKESHNFNLKRNRNFHVLNYKIVQHCECFVGKSEI